MYGHQNAHLQLRKATALEIRQNGSAIFNIIDTCPDENNSFMEHVRRLSTEGEAAGQDAIMALTRVNIKNVIFMFIWHFLPLRFSKVKTKQRPMIQFRLHFSSRGIIGQLSATIVSLVLNRR